MIRHARLRAALLAAVATLALTSPAAAGEFRSDETVTVGAGETIDDDLYAAAGTIILDGTVNGDATVAGGTVQVNGTVTGSLNIGGGTVEVLGVVEGAVRVAGGNVRIAGSVGRDVVAFAGNVVIDPGAEVAGDVAGGTGALVMNGAVGGDLLAGAGTLQIGGSVDGSVDAGVGDLTIESGAVLGGDVTYTSANEATVASGAQIGGEITRREPEVAPQTSVVSDNPIVSYFGTLLGMLLLGWTLLALRPRLTLGSADVLRTSPLITAGIGLGALIGQFLLMLILILAAAVVGIIAGALGGAFIVLAIVLLLLMLLAIIFATVPVAMTIGRLLLPDQSPYLAYLAGAAILSLVIVGSSFVPALGGLVFVLVWVFGLGAFVVYLYRTRDRPYLLVEPAATPEVVAPPA